MSDNAVCRRGATMASGYSQRSFANEDPKHIKRFYWNLFQQGKPIKGYDPEG